MRIDNKPFILYQELAGFRAEFPLGSAMPEFAYQTVVHV